VYDGMSAFFETFLLLVVGQSLSHRYSFGLQSCKLFWKDGPWWLWRWPNSSLSRTHKKGALLQLHVMTYVQHANFIAFYYFRA